ncbi:MAG: aconitate hydratase AcnA [Planctomycetota bacterium]|nr:MAG: aconitate hydratase AcnA [Planctomycetota bacterium]
MPSAALQNDPFGARDTFDTKFGRAGIYRLARLEQLGLTNVGALPFSIRVLLESCLRNCDGYVVTEEDVKNLANWGASRGAIAPGGDGVEIPFKPARVVLQDFTGVPCVVDLAAMRAAMRRLGGDPKKINPLTPVDLVVDHSVQVDHFGTAQALDLNIELEFSRNRERYEFLRWGQLAFNNFRVVPPGTGIVHQVNLEYLAKCVFLRPEQGAGPAAPPVALPDSLVGTDSHTTMIDGLGVVGWGVGGIEAEGVMLGQPIYMLMPEVVGMKLTGALPAGATATDLVLTVTQVLRKHGVVNKFVEFFGDGVSTMSLADRATIGNMAPEYGATMGFFPIDDETLRYLSRTGRTPQEVELVERYAKEQGLYRTDAAPPPSFTSIVELDLSTVEPCLAGPKRPQDRIPLSAMKATWRKDVGELYKKQPPNGAASPDPGFAGVSVQQDGKQFAVKHGDVVIAAITSCTNTSNPSVMIAAGLLAKKAVERGLAVPPHVKTSLAPGSRVVTDYFQKAGLQTYLDKLGFNTVGYGCTTCIGNSGPLPEAIAGAVQSHDLVVAGVLSGNRNFEGRINPHVKANYLASPPLVVAYAIAGTTDVNLFHEPLGKGAGGQPVYLRDVWPTRQEVEAVIDASVLPEMFQRQYDDVWKKNEKWNALPVAEGELYQWDPSSTYIQEPPFLIDLTPEAGPIQPIPAARCLAALGDSVTTDHISPAGSIAKSSPAGKFLIEHGVEPADFNSYGARRGNDRVMTRGTFANIRIRNFLAPGTEGGVTRHLPDGQIMSIYDAAMKYKAEGVPLVVLAGAEYGTGSSRDWAAKGTFLLGVRAVIAASFERIHRSNLVGMGVLPLELPAGVTWQALGLTGEEVFEFPELDASLKPRQVMNIVARRELPAAAPPAGSGAACDPLCTHLTFPVTVRIDTPVELDYYRNGGILQTVLRKLLAER